MTSQPQVKLSLLSSPPQIEHQSMPLHIPLKNAFYLFVYLADQEGDYHDRDDVERRLGWDEKSLREILFRLRKRLPIQCLPLERNSDQTALIFDRTGIEVDTHEFAQQAHELISRFEYPVEPDTARRIYEVLSLYKSHFLYKENFKDNSQLETWASERRKTLAELRHSLMEKLIQFHIAYGQLSEAHEIANQWLGSFKPGYTPLQYLIWIAVKQTRYADLEVFLRQLRNLENDERILFGKTSKAWRDLIHSKDDPSLDVIGIKPRFQIPHLRALPQNYVTRTAIRDHLRDLFLDPTSARVIGLTGQAGVGKTLLASWVIDSLRRLRPRYEIVWLDLQYETDLEMLFDNMLRQLRMDTLLGLSYTEKQRQFKQLIQAISCVIVIDEGRSQKLADAEFMKTIVSLFEGAHLLLVASKLGMNQFYEYSLPGFDESMVRQFLVRRVPQLKTLRDAEVHDITTFTQGLPLLLQLIAGGLKHNRIGFIQFLNEQMDYLKDRQEGEISGYAILLNWLWGVLSETEQLVLYAMSLFDSLMGCDESDLARVIPNQTPSAIKSGLQHLVDLGIVSFEGKDQKRFQLHSTLHLIIESQAQGEMASSMSVMREAYMSYIVEILTNYSNDFFYLDRWRQDIVRMFKIALPAPDAPDLQNQALSVLNIACHYLDRRGFYGMVKQVTTLALQHANVDVEHPTRMLSRLGQIALKQSDLTEAENYFKQARILAQQEEHAEAYALSFRDLGILALRKRNFETASDYLDQAEEFAAEAGNEILWGQIKVNLGVIAYSQGNYVEAVRLFQTIEDHLESTLSDKNYDYQDLIQFIQNTRGAIAIVNEQYSSAKTHFEKALIAARELNNPERIARAYFNLGIVSYYNSDISGAFSYFTQGAVIAEYTQHNELLAWAWWNQAALHIIQKEHDNARRLLQMALNRANDFSLKSIPSYVFIWFGISYFHQDKHKRSRAYYVKALNELNASAWTSALALYGIGLIVRSNKDLGMTDDSETSYRQIVKALKYLGLGSAQFKRITATEMRRAETYFQIALPHIPELWRYHIVGALLRWLEQAN